MTAQGVEALLVGAGPGDPNLLTLAGAAALSRADVVVYDYLANPALLAHAPQDAERVYVGKKGFSEHVTQRQINELLVQRARDLAARGGGVLVRLKGGDPFVFGRGGEEALALAEAGFPCPIVPGVTSGVAAPAFAGIPVTHRGLASSVTFVTGSEDPTKAETAVDWSGIAHGADTLCFYMGVRNLPVIARRLMEAGRSADTPVSLVRWGTTPMQEVLAGTLATIAERAAAVGFKAPVSSSWAPWPPCAGGRLGTSPASLRARRRRPRAQASGLTERLRALGASVIELPVISIAAPSSFSGVDSCIERLAGYRFVVFTSANGVKAFFERLVLAGLDARALACARIAAIGPATAAELAERGIVADLVPGEFRAEAVADLLIEAGLTDGDWVLVPRALEARDVLPRMLRACGARVDVVPVYRTVPPSRASAEPALASLIAGEADAVTFTSSSTVRNFVGLVRDVAPNPVEVLERLDFYSIGPITTTTARDESLRIAAQAEAYTIDGLVEAIVKHRASCVNET
ncbi:MAG: uroporphyrinogen-III C-methyltransferase [Eggerthella lenta]